MAIYNEAHPPGSSIPQPLGGPNGSVIPPLQLREIPQQIAGVSRDFTAGSFLRPPHTTTGKPRAFLGEITKSRPPIGDSVASTVYNATPLSNVTSVLSDIPGLARRPIIPAGLRERTIDALPPGIRQRATSWNRAIAGWHSSRPSQRNRVTRE